MQRKHIVAAAAALLAGVPVLAQPVRLPSIPVPPVLPGAPALPPGAAGVPQDPRAMLAQFEAAQAMAPRPGDENLSCEALETEIAATMSDPAIAAYAESAGAAAQQDLDALQAAQGPLAAAQTGTAIAGAFTPGSDRAAILAGAAQAQAAQVQAAQRMQSQMLRAQELTALMPKFLRGQHLVELATTKQCEWLAGAGALGPMGLPNPPQLLNEREQPR
jgi:hypothetical protein